MKKSASESVSASKAESEILVPTPQPWFQPRISYHNYTCQVSLEFIHPKRNYYMVRTHCANGNYDVNIFICCCEALLKIYIADNIINQIINSTAHHL